MVTEVIFAIFVFGDILEVMQLLALKYDLNPLKYIRRQPYILLLFTIDLYFFSVLVVNICYLTTVSDI